MKDKGVPKKGDKLVRKPTQTSGPSKPQGKSLKAQTAIATQKFRQ